MSEIKVFTKEQQKEHPQLTKEYKETLNKLKEDLDFVLPNWIEFDDKIYFDDPKHGAPDGMQCDEWKNIYVAGPGGIWAIYPVGDYWSNRSAGVCRES